MEMQQEPVEEMTQVSMECGAERSQLVKVGTVQ